MSLQAISWALDASRAGGNDRLVVIVMCHYTDDSGFSGCSKATLAEETLLSEATIIRCQNTLMKLTEIERAAADDGPDWWLAIPRNRRPALFRMTGFLGSHFATSARRRTARKPGVALGSHRGLTGVNRTPSDQGFQNAISDQRSENTQPADPNCVRCQGRGAFYRANGDPKTGGFEGRCPCTFAAVVT